MLAPEFISTPPHYGADRTIQPIEVAEEWLLCHHLACALMYIARAAHRENAIADLQKAEWYLTRELSQLKNDFSKCQMKLTNVIWYTPEQVALDWNLSHHLAEAIRHIRQARYQINTRLTALFQARACLIAEMNKHDQL